MPVDLAELLAGRALPGGRPQALPARFPAAVLTMELQRGVVGDLSSFPELAEAASVARVAEHTARLLVAARAAGVPVVHCTAEFRADRRGTVSNTPLHTAVLRRPEHLLEGTAATELTPGIGPAPVGPGVQPAPRGLAVHGHLARRHPARTWGPGWWW